MYSFGPEFEGREEEELYTSETFKKHARGVVKMLDAAVNMLGPDLEPVTHALTDLGGRHVSYGVLPAHYGIVGEALLFTLATALGDAWTPKVKKGWEGMYSFVSTAMIAGAEHWLEKRRKRKEGRTVSKPIETHRERNQVLISLRDPLTRPRDARQTHQRQVLLLLLDSPRSPEWRN
jgi:hemoglobin-like flavoprotein